jgi:two-component system CheB/CheR fusion protein
LRSGNTSDSDPVVHERLRVLIVDDCADNATSSAQLITLFGHEARCSCDGAGALEIVQVFQPQVILIDLAMPRMDGFQFAGELRERAGLKLVRLVALTGYADEKHRRQCAEAGFDYFLAKPVEPEVLQQLLCACRDRVPRPASADAPAAALEPARPTPNCR